MADSNGTLMEPRPVVNFGKLEPGMPMPDLLSVQLESFRKLVKTDVDPERAWHFGLDRVFRDIFPVTDVNGDLALEYVSCSLEDPEYDVEDCIERDMTHSRRLKAKLRLVVYEKSEKKKKKGAVDPDVKRRIEYAVEKEVYLGDLPELTDLGTFIVNGAERVVVSQLHRSPGVVFEEDTHPNGTRLYKARIIPFRGSWVEFRIDINDVCYVHIDKKKKFPATALLRAFGYGTDQELYGLFFNVDDERVPAEDEDDRDLGGLVAAEDVVEIDAEVEDVDPETGEVQTGEAREIWRISGGNVVDVVARVEDYDRETGEVTEEVVEAETGDILGTAVDILEEKDNGISVVARDSGEVLGQGRILLPHGAGLGTDYLQMLRRVGFETIRVYRSRHAGKGGRPGESPVVKNTIGKDPTDSEEAALNAIYSLLRPGDAPNMETARAALESLFFDPRRYDLGRVGRYKINQRLEDTFNELPEPLGRLGEAFDPAEAMNESRTVLTKHDFVALLRYLFELNEGRGHTDDIDHLGNRRVRTVGELIANQFSVGLSRMARLVRERMTINTDHKKINIDDLVNARTVSAVIQAFFGSSQLSQFMDQTNPLSELTHKRRLSALGPGGLTRERAGFEVRDVHYSHYGRMCPIETPEGPNIGLITSLATYSRVNDLGFVETPYRKVVDGRVTGEIEWLDASREQESSIAQANAPLLPDGQFRNEFVLCRRRGDFPLLRPAEIDFIDVAPDQLVSVAAALIPFLEHDDANRALMGSNMQRQAVPLLHTDAPLVGTGLESKVARDSGAVTVAKRDGRVVRVTADEVIVDTGLAALSEAGRPLAKLSRFDHYPLKKFRRTNQDTAINHRPLVRAGQSIAGGEIIADGPSTDLGELALGRNLRVAFMPWYGYNFEDAIVLSERLVRDDIFTSIHIQELELHVRDTKLGMEEITREIPNVAEEHLGDLDDRGIIRIGAQVRSGDVLCGKVTPKGETDLSPEEKLLTAIFGEKAKDVKDSSLRVSPGIVGTVIDVKIFSRRIDDPLLENDHGARIGELRSREREDIQRVGEARDEEVLRLLEGQTIALCLKKGTVEPYFPEGTELTERRIERMVLSEIDLAQLKVRNRKANAGLRRVILQAGRMIERFRRDTEDQIDKVFQPDELPPGVVQLVKVCIAEKRKISVGDKMAGRHGNKGIIARIAPGEDMPCLPDGTPVDIVLNPLGVPSRMNVGQVLETHLGWAADILGFDARTPVFHGASEDEIALLLRLAGAKWAGSHLAGSVRWPFNAADYHSFLRLVRKHPEVGQGGMTTNGNGGGQADGPGAVVAIGKALDAYVEAEQGEEATRLFTFMRDFLVAAGIEAAASRRRPLKRDFPAIAALSGKKNPGPGLEAALLEFLAAADILPNGKVWLRDGRSGERFKFPVTVGAIYMLKLSHLVDDKIHARSIGPYSLVTQQPLAGKAQFGGQRFGEMEVWALEAFGAAHTLQEILTVKSDDVTGRSRVYEAIVKGENLPNPGVPESFNVLVKELQALGLAVDLGTDA